MLPKKTLEGERERVRDGKGDCGRGQWRGRSTEGLGQDAQKTAGKLGSDVGPWSSASTSGCVLLDGFLRQMCTCAGVRGHRAGWVNSLSIAKLTAKCHLTTQIVSLDFCPPQEC